MHGMDPKLYDKIHKNGYQAREGDKVSGVWHATFTGWHVIGGGGIYLVKGARLKATWQFTLKGRDAPRWYICLINTDNIMPPKRVEIRPAFPFTTRNVLILVAVAMAVSSLLVFGAP